MKNFSSLLEQIALRNGDKVLSFNPQSNYFVAFLNGTKNDKNMNLFFQKISLDFLSQLKSQSDIIYKKEDSVRAGHVSENICQMIENKDILFGIRLFDTNEEGKALPRLGFVTKDAAEQLFKLCKIPSFPEDFDRAHIIMLAIAAQTLQLKPMSVVVKYVDGQRLVTGFDLISKSYKLADVVRNIANSLSFTDIFIESYNVKDNYIDLQIQFPKYAIDNYDFGAYIEISSGGTGKVFYTITNGSDILYFEESKVSELNEKNIAKKAILFSEIKEHLNDFSISKLDLLNNIKGKSSFSVIKKYITTEAIKNIINDNLSLQVYFELPLKIEESENVNSDVDIHSFEKNLKLCFGEFLKDFLLKDNKTESKKNKEKIA